MLLLIAAHVALIWWHPYVPTNDGPRHVYSATVLRYYWDSRYEYDEWFEFRWTPMPNWGATAFLAGLMLIASPLAAEKLLLTIYVAGTVFAVRSLLAAVRPGQERWSILVFPFLFGWVFFWGFYSYLLGIPLGLFLLAWTWKRRDDLRRRDAALLACGAAALFLTHLVSYSLAVLGLVSVGLDSWIRGRRRVGLSIVAALAPSWLLVANYLGGTEFFTGLTLQVLTTAPRSWDRAIAGILDKPLAPFVEEAPWFGALVWQIFAMAAVCGLLGATRKSSRRDALGRFNRPLALVGLALLGLVVVMPSEWGPHGGLLHERLAQFLAILGLTFLPCPTTIMARSLILASGILVGTVHVALLHEYLGEGNATIAEYVGGQDAVIPGSRVLPLSCPPALSRKDDRVALLMNGGNYYCLSPGTINLANHEAANPHFPIRWRPTVAYATLDDCECTSPSFIRRFHPLADTLVVSHVAPPDVASAIAEYYDLVHSEGIIRIYRRRAAADRELPERSAQL